MVQNYGVETDQEEDASLHMRVEFKLLRRSNRLHPKEGSYENMQGRSAKRRKLTDKRSTDTFSSNETSKEPAPGDSTNKTRNRPSKTPSESPSKNPLNPSGTSEQTIGEPSVLATFDTHVPVEGGEFASASLEGDILSQEDVFNILEEYFEQSPGSGSANDKEGLDSRPTPTVECARQNGSLVHTVRFDTPPVLTSPQHPLSASVDPTSSEALETLELDSAVVSATISESGSSTVPSEHRSVSTVPSSYPPSEAHDICYDLPSGVQHLPCFKRSTLDESAQWLEHVLNALEAANGTSRRPDSSVPGILDDILMNGDFTLCVKVMTTIAENLVKCSRCIAKPAFDAAQQRSREIERNKIAPHVRRLTSAYTSRILRQKDFPDDIARLDMRDIAQLEIQRILSEPQELTGELREESDYETAIKHIEKDNADNASIGLRRLWKQTYFWPMIQQRAKMIGPLPTASGRKADITPQEKCAAKRLILAMGYGQSRNNIFKWTAYLKLLSDLRDNRATALLLYRTREFKSYFFQHPKELDMLLSWNRVYDFPLRQLGARTLAQEGNDYSGGCDIEEKWIFDRLHAPYNMCWGDHLTLWNNDSTEREDYMANHKIKPTSGKSNIHVLRHGLKGQPDCNNSSFVNLVPYEGESGKRTLGTQSSSIKLLAVAPLVPIIPGDFLGIFSGRLRYTEEKPPRSIPGPIPNLWLEYSVVMGKLSKIRVAKADEMANVCLAWEGVNEVKGEKSNCQFFRILVIATRHMMPLDQLVRPPI